MNSSDVNSSDNTFYSGHSCHLCVVITGDMAWAVHILVDFRIIIICGFFWHGIFCFVFNFSLLLQTQWRGAFHTTKVWLWAIIFHQTQNTSCRLGGEVHGYGYGQYVFSFTVDLCVFLPRVSCIKIQIYLFIYYRRGFLFCQIYFIYLFIFALFIFTVMTVCWQADQLIFPVWLQQMHLHLILQLVAVSWLFFFFW